MHMGRTKGLYNAEFEVGEAVRIANLDVLTDFAKRWHYHHKITSQQFAYAGQLARVKSVAFYHGGDELYELEVIPGMWHEECLLRVSKTPGDR